MRRMDHVITGLIGKRDLRDIDAPRTTRTRASLRIRKGDEGDIRLGNDHAQGNVDIDDVDQAATQTP